MIDWLPGDAETRRALVKRCSADREELTRRLDLLYPREKDRTSSEKVERVLTDVCRFHVVDEPLPSGQLAVCDFSNRLVIVNSEMGRFVHHKTCLDLLRRSTLAHELGHIRLHWDEVQEGCTLHYFGESGQFSDARAYQKEREADLYSGLFLVPLESLLKEPSIQNLLRSKRDSRPIASGTLWKTIYRCASVFKVSPTLMKRCLVDLGWVKQHGHGTSRQRELSVRF